MKNLFMLLILSNLLFAKSNSEILGDIFSIAIPVGAYGTSLYLDDKEGQMQFYKSYATSMATTYLLKYTLREKRPDSDNKDSFPSGHTSSAFAGASFLHMRYSLEKGIIPYLAAIFTAYSRVDSNKHHTSDVVAGAIISMLSSYYFVTPYKNLHITPIYKNDFKGLSFNYKW